MDEDFDDRSESCKSDNSRFSQTFLIKQQDEPELPKFSQSSSLNNEEFSSATAIDHPLRKHKQTKTKRRQSDHRQRYGNVGVQSLYHGIVTTFHSHNASSYNSDKKALIISLLTSCKLVKTPRLIPSNAEVASWWKGSSKSDSSSLHSMIFEDNVGEDVLSAQLSNTIDINDSNYIDNVAPHPTMFDNEVL